MKMLFNIIGLAVFFLLVLNNVSSIAAQSPNKSDDAYLNIPEEDIEFNDQSAPLTKENLESQQYNDFIHKLYRFDADNLQKFDNAHHSSS